jgi:hypothetical protein
MDNELKGEEKKLRQHIKPILIKGQPASINNPADIDYFKREHILTDKKTRKESLVDLRQPLKINFQGYAGFLTPEDEKNSSEGKTTLGVTISSPLIFFGEENKCEIFNDNQRSIVIKLKKELFLNREGYDELLVKVYKLANGGYGRSYYDISFEEVVETIAHELAHAVVNSIQSSYEGEKKGGHGKLHDEITERMEEMIRKSSEFSEFET